MARAVVRPSAVGGGLGLLVVGGLLWVVGATPSPLPPAFCGIGAVITVTGLVARRWQRTDARTGRTYL